MNLPSTTNKSHNLDDLKNLALNQARQLDEINQLAAKQSTNISQIFKLIENKKSFGTNDSLKQTFGPETIVQNTQWMPCSSSTDSNLYMVINTVTNIIKVEGSMVLPSNELEINASSTLFHQELPVTSTSFESNQANGIENFGTLNTTAPVNPIFSESFAGYLLKNSSPQPSSGLLQSFASYTSKFSQPYYQFSKSQKGSNVCPFCKKSFPDNFQMSQHAEICVKNE